LLVALRLLHGPLLAVGFDRASARSLGATPAVVDAALLVLLAVAIVVAVQGLGTCWSSPC
jgi:ABC-type Mn2+/Zn2+ transport system permease subunit